MRPSSARLPGWRRGLNRPEPEQPKTPLQSTLPASRGSLACAVLPQLGSTRDHGNRCPSGAIYPTQAAGIQNQNKNRPLLRGGAMPKGFEVGTRTRSSAPFAGPRAGRQHLLEHRFRVNPPTHPTPAPATRRRMTSVAGNPSRSGLIPPTWQPGPIASPAARASTMAQGPHDAPAPGSRGSGTSIQQCPDEAARGPGGRLGFDSSPRTCPQLTVRPGRGPDRCCIFLSVIRCAPRFPRVCTAAPRAVAQGEGFAPRRPR